MTELGDFLFGLLVKDFDPGKVAVRDTVQPIPAILACAPRPPSGPHLVGCRRLHREALRWPSRRLSAAKRIADALQRDFQGAHEPVEKASVEVGEALAGGDLSQDFRGVAQTFKGPHVEDGVPTISSSPCSRHHKAPSRFPLSTVDT